MGYPTGDPQAISGGTRQTFQHGVITSSTSTGRTTVTR
ncbi:hypothetical protein [Blastococcus sp. SYSU D00695]